MNNSHYTGQFLPVNSLDVFATYEKGKLICHKDGSFWRPLGDGSAICVLPTQFALPAPALNVNVPHFG